MQLKTSKSRSMASLNDEEQIINRQNNNNAKNSPTNNISTVTASTSSSTSTTNNNNEETFSSELRAKRESLEARKQALEHRLSEKSWFLQQIQKQEGAIMNGNYEYMTINEFFAQLTQQYKHEQQLQLSKESNAILRRKQSTTSRESHQPSNSSYNRHSETLSNRSSEYDNYQPAGAGGDMLMIGAAQQQAQQQLQVKSAFKKRSAQIQYMAQAVQRQQQAQQPHSPQEQHSKLQQHSELYAQQKVLYEQAQTRSQPDVISLYSANSTNVAMLRQHVPPQQQPVIVQCDKYYLSPTHQNYDGGFIKSSQNIKKYISPLASPSNISYELQPSLQPSMQHLQHQRQLDAISLAPSYISMDTDCIHQQFRWRSQSHIPPLTPTQQHMPIADSKSHSTDMLSAPATRYPRKVKPLDEISLSSLNPVPTSTSAKNTTSIEKKPKSKQWLESSLDGPAVIRQMDPPDSPTCGGSAKSRAKLSSQSLSVAGRHYSMSSQRQIHNYPTTEYAAASNTKALQHSDERYSKLSQSTSYLNAMEKTLGISASYPLEPLDIPPFRNLPPKPNQTQQPAPPPRPPPVQQTSAHHSSGSHINNTALVSPSLVVATANLSPDIRIESPKNVTVVQQATFQPYKEVTKPFEMSDFYKYSTKFKQKDIVSTNRLD